MEEEPPMFTVAAEAGAMLFFLLSYALQPHSLKNVKKKKKEK